MAAQDLATAPGLRVSQQRQASPRIGIMTGDPPRRGGDPEGSSRQGNEDLPLRAVTRAAKLAALPVGLAGRTALGLGKRLGGRPAELVAHEIQQRTAEQIFRVL